MDGFPGGMHWLNRPTDTQRNTAIPHRAHTDIHASYLSELAQDQQYDAPGQVKLQQRTPGLFHTDPSQWRQPGEIGCSILKRSYA